MCGSVCCVLALLLFGGVMLPCLGALLCRRHRYTAYRLLVSLCGGYRGKDIHVPLPFLCCPQDTRRISITRLWIISRSARVTELLGIILGFEVAPMLLDSLGLIWPLHS